MDAADSEYEELKAHNNNYGRSELNISQEKFNATIYSLKESCFNRWLFCYSNGAERQALFFGKPSNKSITVINPQLNLMSAFAIRLREKLAGNE